MSQPTPYICPTCHKKHMPGQNCFTSTLQGAPASQSYSISPNVPFYRTPYGQFELTLTFRPTSDQTRSNPQWDPSQNLSAPPRSLMYREEDEIAGVPGFGPSRGFNQHENYTQNMQNQGGEQFQNRIGGQRSAYPPEAIPHTLPGSSYASGYQSSAGSVYHERGAEFPQFQSIEPPSHGMQSNANFDQNSNYLAQAEGHSSTAPWPMQRMDQTSVYSSPVKKKDPLNPYAPVYDSSSDLNASPSPPTARWRETVPSEAALRQGKNSIDDLQTPDEYNLPQARLGTVSRNPEFVSATSNDPAYSFYSTSPPYTSKFNTSATSSGYPDESTPFYPQASQNQPPRLPDASMTADDKWAAQPNPSQCQSYTTTPWNPSEFAYLKLGSYDNLTLWKGYNRPQEAASNIICSTDPPGRVPDQPETCLETEDPCQTPVIGFPTTGALGPNQSEPELPLEAHDRQAQLPEPSIAADVEQPDENAPALSYAQALASKAKAAPVMYTHHSPITMQVEWQRYKSCYTRLFDRIDARDAHMFENKSEVAFCRMCQKKRLVPISEMLPHLLYEHRCSCCDRLIPGKDLADHIKERNCVKCGKHKTECFMAHINHEKTCRRKPRV